MFLAVYHLDNLLHPEKVLTHADDIALALAAANIRCGRNQALAHPGCGDEGNDALLLAAAASVAPVTQQHRLVLRMAGPPCALQTKRLAEHAALSKDILSSARR